MKVAIMPEGPEVRRYADTLHHALNGKEIVAILARTKAARAFLSDNPDALLHKPVLKVWAHGKNLIGCIGNGSGNGRGDGYYFHSHLMMWGRWQVATPPPAEIDRRERARITVDGDPAMGNTAAILLSAPIFELGQGDPYDDSPHLRSLGPDILPYDGPGAFDKDEFLRRLLAPDVRDCEIGAALLNQTIAAGVGNYLRAEILFLCELDPWRKVGELTEGELNRLCITIPDAAARAYRNEGGILTEQDRQRVAEDSTLRYPNSNAEWAMRHYVFHRTNLPCLRCGNPIRQKQQVTRHLEDGEEKERIIYFCPTCQRTSVPLPPIRPTRSRATKPPVEEVNGKATPE